MAACKKRSRLGTTIIDELRLCYTAESCLLQTLSSTEVGKCTVFGTLSLYRIIGQHFRYVFIVVDEYRNEVGKLYFGRYGDIEACNYIWFKAANKLLYETWLYDTIQKIQSTLSLCFNNFTSLDLSKDFTKNITYTIKRYMTNPQITTIINGKAVRDRKHIIQEAFYVYKCSLDRIKDPTFYIAQKEAVNNKAKGVRVCSYDKKSEIAKSRKEYINEFYNNPKRLFRLEIHLNSDEIRDYLNKWHTQQTIDIISDKGLLTAMYYYHLSSVLRFSKGRKPIPWSDILSIDNPR